MAQSNESAGRSASRWCVVGDSVRGQSHRRTGRECEDAHIWRTAAGGLLVAAVADGAGSASLGGVGANLAVRAATELMCEETRAGAHLSSAADWAALLTGAADAARNVLLSQATIRRVELRELATTLLILAAMPGWTAALQVGDGAIVVSGADVGLRAITTPENDEYVNDTMFLTSDQGLVNPQVVVWPEGVRHAALLTDGLQRLALLMPGCRPHAPFFDPLFRFALDCANSTASEDELADFLRSPRISEKCDDDLTLVLAARVDGDGDAG